MSVSFSPSVWSRPRWPRWLVVGGVGLGLVVASGVLSMVPVAVHPLLTLGLIGLTVTFGMSCAALAMMIGALLSGLAGNRDPLGESRAPRALVAIAALPVAAMVLGAMLAIGVWSAGAVFVVVAALAATAFALIGWSRPWPTSVALLMMAMVFITVEVARETGHLNVSWFKSATDTDTERKLDGSCTTHGNWNGPREFGAFASGARVYLDLHGNIGDLVRSRGPAPDPFRAMPSRLADIEIRGTVEAPVFGCWFPLYKRVTLDARLEITGHLEVEDGDATARCTSTGTLDVHIEHTAWGIRSCHQLRQGLADELRGVVDKTINEMID